MRLLTWPDIDLRRKVIIIRDSKNALGREIPINKDLQRTIDGLARKIHNPYVLTYEKGRAGEGTKWKKARPLGSVKRSFKTACDKAGIKDFHFHDLRHTFASWAVMSGVDLITLKDLLGHKTTKMVFRYAHLSADHKRQALDRMVEQFKMTGS